MMVRYTERIREIARALLDKGEVSGFIGFEAGTVPMMRRPVLIRKPEEADRLVWDSHCALNLCNYLTGRAERLGILATGCVSRSLVNHIVENQIKREQLHVVGVPCEGMIDHRKVMRAVGGREVLHMVEEDAGFRVRGRGFEERFDKGDFLQGNCRVCTHRNPVIHDDLVAEAVPEQASVNAYRDVEKIEQMGPDERWGFFQRMFSRCIRCYACRDACPLCYCPTCFVDESRPQWVGKSTDPVDRLTFHFLRAYHCAGRCTDCGACERVCPVGIPVRQLTKKLNKDVQSFFSWEAGLTLDERPPLDVYRPEDYNDFVR
jgi:ferredoxin